MNMWDKLNTKINEVKEYDNQSDGIIIHPDSTLNKLFQYRMKGYPMGKSNKEFKKYNKKTK